MKYGGILHSIHQHNVHLSLHQYVIIHSDISKSKGSDQIIVKFLKKWLPQKTLHLHKSLT